MSGPIINFSIQLMFCGYSKTFRHTSNNFCKLFDYIVHFCRILKKINLSNKYNTRQFLNIHFFQLTVMQMDVFRFRNVVNSGIVLINSNIQNTLLQYYVRFVLVQY